MKRILPVLVLSAIAFLFSQCHKDLSYIGMPDTGVAVNPSPITANLQGNITDENNNPAAGASVTIGTTTVSTDANGFFHLNNVSLDKNTSLVTVQKDGYFKGYRVFAATSGCNQVAIKLIRRTLAGTIPSSSGGDVTGANGAKISLSSNSIVTLSSGGAYNGDVKVYAAYIDPTSSDISKTIPGSLVANDKNGKRVILSSFGMLAVELEATDGTALQIKSGNTASLTIPIPAATLSAAPASISLWYVDKATGIWTEEGTASKNGNVYVGTVKHFSFWNCDYPNDAVNLSMTLQTGDAPLVNVSVKLTATADSSSSAYGWTDSLGQVSGRVPLNKDIKLEVIDQCNNTIYTKDLGILTQNTELGVINITNTNSYLLTFKGTLVDCSNAPVTNGYALISFDGNTRYVATNATGQFNTNYIVCSGTSFAATVLGVNESAQQQGQLTNVTASFPATDAGNISACGTSSDEFVTYILDDTTYTINRIGNDSLFAYQILAPNSTLIGAQDGLGGQKKRINFSVDNTTGTGIYPLTRLSVGYYFEPTIEQPFNVTFTSFATAPGEFYEGSFSGKFLDSSAEHTISATFRIRQN